MSMRAALASIGASATLRALPTQLDLFTAVVRGEAAGGILIAIFDDRLEIQDPGSFVYGSTVETIKQGISQVRNRAIVRILRALHLVQAAQLSGCRCHGATQADPLPSVRLVRVIRFP
jgi:hypothetical protein